MTVLCVLCPFCGSHVHVRAADLDACQSLAPAAVELHMEIHVSEMTAEVVR